MSGIGSARDQIVWHVRESQYSLFHLEPPLDQDQALAEVLSSADSRTEAIRPMLALPTIAGAIDYKTNWWFYYVREEAGHSWGQVTASGVDMYNSGPSWLDQIEPMIHEEIHVTWTRVFGEAPALLNEGIPEYFQRLVQSDPPRRLRELESAWQKMDSEQGFLRPLCENECFWKAKMEGEPVYGVAGMVIRHLLERLGMAGLQRLFCAIPYESTELAGLLEAHMGQTVEELEGQISRFVVTKR